MVNVSKLDYKFYMENFSMTEKVLEQGAEGRRIVIEP